MNKNKGFTLVEMMIVVAIIGILAAIGMPAYNDYIERGELADAKQATVSLYQSFEANRLARPNDFRSDVQFKAELGKEKSKISKRITNLYSFTETISMRNNIPVGFSFEVQPLKSGKKYYMKVDERGMAERCTKKNKHCEKF